jgi:aminoglycoside phosphotransferase family enzyme/predicted kinase
VDPVATLPVTVDVDAFLAAGAGSGERCERIVETSIARLFLFRDRVLKVKKPMDFGFLDFTTLEQRRWALERELAFNRETAPDLYRGVKPVVGAGGALRLGGEGQPLEWVLEMRRFPDGALLAERPERIDGDLAERLGREVARFHLKAAPVEDGGAGLAYVLASNAQLLRAQAGRLGGGLEPMLSAASAAFERAAPLLEKRARAGFVRRCHGDLHLGNIFLEGDTPVMFDCIEFNDALSQIDVLYDLAFLLMDLAFRGRLVAANRALNGWLDEAARGLADGLLFEGLSLLPLFQSVRAAVRVHVALHQGQDAAARAYLDAAARHLQVEPPRLVAVGGRSGSGKSTYARQIAPGLGGAPGAVVLRSDEIRKRLWKRGPLDRLPSEAYTPQEGVRVYAAMIEAARNCLAAGRAVVLDAAFLKPAERAVAERLGAEAGVAFEGFWMDAPAEVLRNRVENRRGDASDADAAVLERQLAIETGEIGWRRAHDAGGVAG